MGKLPWQNHPSFARCKTSKERYEKILEIKQKATVEELCKNMPASIGEFLKYCKALEFADEPDYR